MTLLHYFASLSLWKSSRRFLGRRYLWQLTVLIFVGILPVGVEAEQHPARVTIDLSSFIDTLRETNEVSVSGLGTFYLKTRKRYTRRNPHGGKPIVVPAKKYLRFKMNKSLLEQVLRDNPAEQ